MTRFLLIAAIAVLVTVEARATSVSFFDTDFATGWEFQTQVSAGNDGFQDPGTTGSIGRVTFQQFRWLAHSHTVVDDDRVFTIALNRGAVYDPSTQGAVGSIDFQLDIRHCCDSGRVGFRLILEQDGVLYSGPGDVSTGSSWTTHLMDGLTVSDMVDLATFVTGDGSQTGPNFSEDGSPITFGYALTNTIVDGLGLIVVQHRGDNWGVTVNPVPLPAAAWLFLSALGVFGVGTRRHRVTL